MPHFHSLTFLFAGHFLLVAGARNNCRRDISTITIHRSCTTTVLLNIFKDGISSAVPQSRWSTNIKTSPTTTISRRPNKMRSQNTGSLITLIASIFLLLLTSGPTRVDAATAFNTGPDVNPYASSSNKAPSPTIYG
jgi:hypothetical protein